MYELYKYYKLRNILIRLLITSLAFLFPYALYEDYVENGFNVNTVIFVVFTLIFICFAICLFYADIDPYKKLKEWGATNPVLVEDMERDFNNSEEYGHRIYKGEKFYFFKGEYFYAIPIGEITAISISKGYQRNLGKINKCKFESKDGNVQVDIPNMIQKEDVCMRLLQEMAFESGIIVKKGK